MTRRIGIQHTHARNIGYGRMGMDLTKALNDLGVNTYDWTSGWEQHLTPVEEVSNPGRPRTVVFVSPGTHVKGWFEGQRSILYTMWEATELPEANRELLHEFDQIIVPSQANLELYSRYHDNVSYVPLGVGPEWHYRPRDPLSVDSGTDVEGNLGIPVSASSFRFLCAGTSPRRKGIDLTAEAFQKAFPDALMLNPRPELIYKSPLGAQVEGVTQYVEGYMSDAEEIELYEGAHVFVSAARGEGFGLQPLQAMAMGIPTILVDAHGHESFASYGIPVKGHLVDAPEEMGFGEAGQWWEVDVIELAQKMREVYEDYAMHVYRAEISSRYILADFSWARTAWKLVDAIGEEWLTELPEFPPMEDIQMIPGGPIIRNGIGLAHWPWHALEPMSYLIRVTVPYAGTVNGVAYLYQPGTDYWDVADVKRQIARMGYLDPSCIDADGVVKPDARLSGSHAYCPTCLQRLGSGIHKADDIMAEMAATLPMGQNHGI